MAFGYCKDCKWWNLKHIAIYGECQLIDGPHGLRDHGARDSEAAISAYEFDGCALETRPLFGCALFEPKE